jgi:acetyltransferase-like isoleucine patch superfamily enzyme
MLGLTTLRVRLGAIGNPSVRIGQRCQFGAGVTISVTDGGYILIGDNVCFEDGVRIVSQGGKVTIESNAFLGIGTILVCRESIHIGKDSLIAEYVVIRDQDHDITYRPIRTAGFLTAPINIGKDVWIGCKATVLRGSTIGDGSVIGAHALVLGVIESRVLAVGVPAKSVKTLGDTP